MDNTFYTHYNINNIRSIANNLVKKYDVKEQHIYWIARELNIYPDGVPNKRSKTVDMARTGRINRNNTEYVSGGRLNEKGIQAIEAYLKKENNELKSEKKELSKMQIKAVDYNKEIDELQKRIGQYNTEINIYSADVSELRKDVSILQTSVNQLQEKKKKLEGVISDLIGCSKRLMNMK